eukprot:6573926-Lingulodinium_polyedra.AAC.1
MHGLVACLTRGSAAPTWERPAARPCRGWHKAGANGCAAGWWRRGDDGRRGARGLRRRHQPAAQ